MADRQISLVGEWVILCWNKRACLCANRLCYCIFVYLSIDDSGWLCGGGAIAC